MVMARRKAPTSLCYGGDETLISSVWKKVPQMFVMRWLLAAAAAAFCEHVNQLVSVCLSFCLSVSLPSRCLIIQGASVSPLCIPLRFPRLPPSLFKTSETPRRRKRVEVPR